MTSPGYGRGAPPFDARAQETLAFTRGQQQQRYVPQALTDAERAEAAKAEQQAQVCPFCIGYHPLPGSPGCPRLASFELDGDGKVKAGTYFAGVKWAAGRVVFYEDTKEDAEDGNG